MPQIKIGHDIIPIPTVRTLVPLYDIVKGVPLQDANGNTLVTEEEGPVEALSKAENSLSVVVNNEAPGTTLDVVEQFAETSEVSTTLLGIPRAEVQLSLFSDVSTYGLNPEEWEFYNYNGIFGRPAGWYRRFNPTYGDHFSTRLVENIEEQALTIESYPVAFTFPEGPNFGDDGYNEAQWNRYLKFIDLGNDLYTEYTLSYPDFAKEHFIDPQYISTLDGDVLYPEDDEQGGYDAIEKWTLAWMDMRDGLLLDPASGKPIRFPEGYDATNTRPGAGSTSRYYGQISSKKAYRYQPGRISGFTYGFRCSRDEASLDNVIEWGIGNPTDQYLFQIRGPQFNIVRRSTVRLPETVLSNMGFQSEDQVQVGSREPFVDTQYYELVIPREFFNGDPLNGNGVSGYLLDPTKVTMYKIEFGWYGAIGAKFYAYVPVDNGDARWVLIHTLTIENQIGEPCLQDPYFKFLYLQDIRDTSSIREPQYLYKYGASCYIDGGDNTAGNFFVYTTDDKPVNNARANAVLGIYPKQEIRNQDGYAKPNKKNVYPVDMKVDCDQLTQIEIVEIDGCPGFGHHYSPSLHAKTVGKTRSINIDAAGQNFTINPQASKPISAIALTNPIYITHSEPHGYFSYQKVTPENIVGTVELNTYEYYVEVLNDTQIALYSDAQLTQPVDGGTGFSAYVSGGETIGNPILRTIDDDAKLIAPYIWSTYARRQAEDGGDFIRRGPEGNYQKSIATLPETFGRDGPDLNEIDTSAVRFTSLYDSIAVSTYPITGNAVDINWLNPVATDTYGQWCEFIVGVTENQPYFENYTDVLGNQTQRLRFYKKDGVTSVEPNLDDILYAEFSHSSIYRNRDGFEVGEGDRPAGVRLDIDYRLPTPRGADSGRCSGVRVTILDRLNYDVQYSTVNPLTQVEDGHYLIFDSTPDQLLNNFDLIGGEFGIDGESSGRFFIGDIVEYVANQQTQALGYFVPINDNPGNNSFTLGLSPIKIEDRTITGDTVKYILKIKVFSFQPKPLYVTIWMRDKARVNNVTITEYINGTTRAFSPEWFVNDGVDIVFSGSSSANVPAANYLETERLASTSSDIQNVQPLRPGILKDTIYASPGKNNATPLTAIYGPDRTTISPGVLNTTATFWTARSLVNNDVNLVSVSVTTKET